MIAYKCDICGALYDKQANMIRYNGVSYVITIYRYNPMRGNDHYELCRVCLTNLMLNGKIMIGNETD